MNHFLQRIINEVNQKGIAYEDARNFDEWLKMDNLNRDDWATENGLSYEFWNFPNIRPCKEKFTRKVTFRPLG